MKRKTYFVRVFYSFILMTFHLTTLSFEIGTAHELHQNGRQNNVDLTDVDDDIDVKNRNCALNGFRVNEDAIIRTQDSRRLGAHYLNETELPSKEECLRWCCQIDGCNVAVFEEKDRGSCYLFDCGPPTDFRCKFTQHHHYVSAILESIPTAEPTSNIHGKTGNSHERPGWIAADEHANDLKNLRQHQRPSSNIMKTTEKETKETILSPSPSAMQTTMSPKQGKPPMTIQPTQPLVTTIQSESQYNSITSTSMTTEKNTSGGDSQATSSSTSKCSHFQFQCRTGNDCIAIYNVCDKIPQCPDASDESLDLCPPDAWRRFEVASKPSIQEEIHETLNNADHHHEFHTKSESAPEVESTGSSFRQKEYESHRHIDNYNNNNNNNNNNRANSELRPLQVDLDMEHSSDHHHGSDSREGHRKSSVLNEYNNEQNQPLVNRPLEHPSLRNDEWQAPERSAIRDRDHELKYQQTTDTSVISQKVHIPHSYVNPYERQTLNHPEQQESQLLDRHEPKYYPDEIDLKSSSLGSKHRQEVTLEHKEMNSHSNRQRYYEDGPSNYDTEHAVGDITGGHYGINPSSGLNDEREYYEGGYLAPNNEYPGSFRQQGQYGADRRPASLNPYPSAPTHIWPRTEYEEPQLGILPIHGNHQAGQQQQQQHRPLPVGYKNHRDDKIDIEQFKIKPDSAGGYVDETMAEDARSSHKNPWPEIPYESDNNNQQPIIRVEHHQPKVPSEEQHVHHAAMDVSIQNERPSVAANKNNKTATTVSTMSPLSQPQPPASPPLVASRHVDVHHEATQIKLSVATDEEKSERASEASGAVLALTLGLSITGLLMVLVGCRLRMVRRRLRRSGRSPYAHDADYLVNGMYL